MIEDKSIGLKIAEDSEEEFWTNFKKKAISSKELAEKEIVINEHLILLCDEKLKNDSKTEISSEKLPTGVG